MANASVFLNKTVVFVNKKIFPSFPLEPVCLPQNPRQGHGEKGSHPYNLITPD
jgi:hypothetical protein